MADIPGVQALSVATPDPGAAAPRFPDAIEAVIRGERPAAVHLQPIVDLHRGAIAGYEALARFSGPPEASPDRWFAEASRAGLGLALEATSLTTALAHLQALPANTFLTVNVSPEFLESTAWHALVDAHPRLDRLVVEITENAAIGNYQSALRAIARARERGASLAVDDVGSGYASLQHIMRLRPDFVKLDRTFISGCDADPARTAMIEAVGMVAARLDAWVVAEGVETPGELRCLLRLGVPLAQGWMLGRPQAGWAAVPDAAAAVIADQRRRSTDRTLAEALMEPWPAVAQAHAVVTPLALTLLLDDDGRPAAWAGGSLSRHDRRPMVVTPATPLGALARKAMTRGHATRFLPVVCTDDDGRYLGVVRIEQIVTRLADATPA